MAAEVVPGRTADLVADGARQRGLCLILPAAEAVLGPWRSEHDWTARNGLPAHVTIRVPMPGELEVTPAAAESLAARLPVAVSLARLEDRPGALVAVAEPDADLRDLTRRVADLLPGLPAHRGDRPDLAYHATIVRTPDADVRTRAAAAIRPHLPLTETTDELCLFEWRGDEQFRVLWRSSRRLVD